MHGEVAQFARRLGESTILWFVGAILDHLGTILGHLLAILGASWVNLGRSWGYLGAISGPSWAIPGPRKDRKWHECEYFLAKIYSDLNQTSDVHNNATQISNMSYTYERTNSCLSLHLFI